MQHDHCRLTREALDRIHAIAGRVYRNHVHRALRGQVTLDDLVNSGYFGWREACGQYDPTGNTSLMGFASVYIYGRMMDYVRRLAPVPMPQKRWEALRRLRAMETQCFKEGVQPTLAGLAERLGCAVDEVAALKQDTPNMTSIDQGNGHQDEHRTVAPHPSLRHDERPEDHVQRDELAQATQACLSRLDRIDRLIVRARFQEELKLREVAAPLGMSMERVRQRQNKALARLRECLAAKGWTTLEEAADERD